VGIDRHLVVEAVRCEFKEKSQMAALKLKGIEGIPIVKEALQLLDT
jgi:hypothetical protein